MKIVKIILILSVFFASCSVQKRHYMKGLYFENFTSKKNGEAGDATIKSFYKKEKNLPVTEKETGKFVASAVPVTNTKPLLIEKPSPADPVILFENCDTLFLRDGTVIAARIIELNQNEIRYRYCSGGETEVIRVILKSSVEQVIYSTGLKEVFEKPKPAIQTQPHALKEGGAIKKLSIAALIGFILALLFWPVLVVTLLSSISFGTLTAYYLLIPAGLLLGGLILNIVGLSETTRKTDKKSGNGLAIAGLLILLVPLLITLIALLLISLQI